MPEEDYIGEVNPVLKRAPIRLRVRHEPEWSTKNVLILTFAIALIALIVGAFVADQVWRTQPEFVITQ